MTALELAVFLDEMADTIDGGRPKMKDDVRRMAAAELRRLAAVEADCAKYLKEGETPAERIKRALGDADSLMTLYRAVVAERDALKAELERIKSLEPVAWIRPSGKAMLEAGGYCTVYASDGMSNHSTALYALGSKT